MFSGVEKECIGKEWVNTQKLITYSNNINLEETYNDATIYVDQYDK